jgi:hypothetical protein
MLNHIQSIKNPMFAKVSDKERPDNDPYWHNELRSLGVAPRGKMTPGEDAILGPLTRSIKQTKYQEHEAAYGTNNHMDSFSNDRKKTLQVAAKESSLTE